jgi:hypothetical protein
MARTGPNYQTTEVIPYGERRYLRPPDTLSDAQRRCFVDLVASLPAFHFKPSDLSLLAGMPKRQRRPSERRLKWSNRAAWSQRTVS